MFQANAMGIFDLVSVAMCWAPEYAVARKLQVYEAALTEALPDGNISGRERELLNRLRDSLGISESDADGIEGVLLKRQLSFA